MLTAHRLSKYTTVACLVLAVLIQQVVSRGLLSDFDKTARDVARNLDAPHDFFSVTVMFGLRGIILTICLPILGWLSWKRRSWVPIAGFLVVLVFETGIAGALKISVGRIFPYQYENFWNRMMIGQDEMAFPSGHAANCVALWGYVAWYFTNAGTRARRQRVPHCRQCRGRRRRRAYRHISACSSQPLRRGSRPPMQRSRAGSTS